MATTAGAAPRLGTPERPVRIVVVGSSVGLYVRPPRADPLEGTYADLLGPMLHEHGICAVVTNRSRWLLMVTEAHRRFQELVLDHRPDVVVLALGFVESQPRLAPLWSVRMLFTWRPRLSGFARRVRRAVLGPWWWAYVHLSPVLIRRMPWLPSRVRPTTFQRGIEAMTRLARKERAALVLALDVPEASDRVERTLATINRRIDETNGVLRALASSPDGPDLVAVSEIVRAHGHDAALPDGIHLSALGHREVATRLVDRIVGWHAAMEGRLTSPTSAGARPPSS
ncbi:MAG: SGNH/GDSL hydrolase family protein [Acidimicrobiales bacterium]